MAKKVGAKVLTPRQREVLLNSPKEYFYVTYGSVTKQWWIQFSKIDKYLGGYNSKEEAQEVLDSGAYLDEEAKWYVGNTLVL